MATVRVHPIQLEYSVSGGRQTCSRCGAEETWTASVEPTVSGPRLHRTLHLVHLVREHYADLTGTFAPAERKKESTVADDVAADGDADED
ncbi:MAG TPA: hypothetical protein VG317_12645 [Pseudonocardiaceae bacterium]|jgi:hypothetical protein|nr:hypothetical protein [Pseudonocardiaceae bacterium]